MTHPTLALPPPLSQRLCILTSLLLHHDDFICINVSQDDDDGTHDAGYGGVERRDGGIDKKTEHVNPSRQIF